MAAEEKKRKRIFGTFILVLVLLIAALLATGAIITSRTGRHVSTYTPPLIVHEAKYEPPANEVFVEAPDIQPTEEAPDEGDMVPDTDYFFTADYFKMAGVIYSDGIKYTWYSQRVLPGGGLDIPGRHVELGFVMDGQNRIVVASIDHPKGTELDIPFGYGKGIVLDTGWLEHNQLDVYTDF